MESREDIRNRGDAAITVSPSTKYTVSVVESVTVGALANLLGGEVGAQEYFVGGMVLYSKQSKQMLIGAEELRDGHAHPKAVRALAKAISQRFNTRCGIAVCGWSRFACERDGRRDGDPEEAFARLALYDSATQEYVERCVTCARHSVTREDKCRSQAEFALAGYDMYLQHIEQTQAAAPDYFFVSGE
jgi:nicotinamide mononucleotide (NMN) deamidase PncC